MVRLIMSGSGEGKTKQLIELMENAMEQEVGCMVCIEPKRNISFITVILAIWGLVALLNRVTGKRKDP